MWHLYILECRDHTLYTGIARDLARRLAQHAKGRGSKYVRSRSPFRLAYSEKCASRSKALKRECEIKSWTRPRKLALINT